MNAMQRDAEVCDVTVILKREYEDRMAEAVEQLKKAGMQVRNADDDNSVVEGSIDSCNIHALEQLDAVQYVRKVMTYNAEYPAGDPRDKNQGMGATPDDEPPPTQRKMGKRYP
jgi:hypothetical protein